MKKLLAAAALFCTISAHAQEGTPMLYKGTIGGNMPVTLFLLEGTNDCNGAPYYQGMYRYDGKSKWLQVDVTNNTGGNMVLVENNITGVLLLKKISNTLNGVWTSPDGSRKLPVKLHVAPATSAEKASFQLKFNEVNANNNDC